MIQNHKMSDDSSLSSESTFDEDRDKYSVDDYQYDPEGHLPGCDYDTDFRGLCIFPYHPTPPPSEWKALGEAMGRSTEIEYLRVSIDGLEEDDEIASADNLEAFISGASNNRSLKILMLEDYDFSRVRLGLLHPFIIENDNLVKFSLSSCQFALHDLQMLSAAFSQRRNPTSIKVLDISGSNIVHRNTSSVIKPPPSPDESIPVVIDICGYCPRIQKLDLSHNRIGSHGFGILATFLANPECKLRHLCLAGMNDDGARVITNSLVGNKKLKTLEVFDRGLSTTSITSEGWKYFLGILRHKSNINATSNSNHTLCKLWDPSFSYDPSHYLPEELRKCLAWNKDEYNYKQKVIQNKIFYFHLNDNVDMFAEDQEILPNLLEWIGDYNPCSYDERITSKTAFYRVIKSYPDLCNYPTYDRKMRNQLEAENTTINTENARLRAENSKLKAQNEELLRKIEQLTMES